MSVSVFCVIRCGHFCIFYFLIVNFDITLIITGADDTHVVLEELIPWISILCPSLVLVLNCELLGGCLGSESRNHLSSASKAIGDGLCVSI